MYIIKNAFISITRNKGRNILIGIIILVISFCATVALAIQTTANDLIDAYEDAYQKTATIAYDRTSMREDFDISSQEGMNQAIESFENISSYTIDDVINYGDSDYVESYDYTYTVSLNGDSIEKVSTEFSFEGNGDDSSSDDGSSRGGEDMPGDGAEMVEASDFSLVGYSSASAMQEIIEGTYTVSSTIDDAWTLLFEGNYVLINEELATLNGIELGQEITLVDSDENTYTFIVAGIYEENSTDTQMPTDFFSQSANTILTNASYLSSLDGGSVEVTFVLYDYDDADAFAEELYEKGLDTSFVVSTNEDEVSSATSSLDNVLTFTTTFLIIVLCIGAVVLFVINMINIRERKYEIGVFRTIGLSKFKLSMQFICELALVGMVAIVIGFGIGAVACKPISNALLSSEVESSSEATEEISQNFGGSMAGEGGDGNMADMGQMDQINGLVQIQAYDSIDAIVSVEVFGELLVVGLLLILISSSASMISIQRFSPLTILKERS